MSKYLCVVFLFACATSTPAPDAPVPIDPAGRYTVRSSFAVSAPPASAAPALAALLSATDGPDDPSRYLIELVIARLPAETQPYAEVVAPFLAAYVNERLDRIAPHLLAGMHALADGLVRVSLRFETREQVEIEGDRLRRTVVGFSYDGVDVDLPGELGVATSVALDGDALAIAPHPLAIPYGDIVRRGFDRVVVPGVDPGASELARALRDLVDCKELAQTIAGWLGIGSPSLYEEACAIGLTAAAAKIYAAFPTAGVSLEASGAAHAIDADHDGTMEAIEGGVWTGTLDGAPLARATFAGNRVLQP